MRSAERMTPEVMREDFMLPAASNSISALITRRSSRGFSEHMPFERASGSMGKARFLVERRRSSHVMRDVRDMDLQMPAAIGAVLDVHGVVKIACRLAVNGNDGK